MCLHHFCLRTSIDNNNNENINNKKNNNNNNNNFNNHINNKNNSNIINKNNNLQEISREKSVFKFQTILSYNMILLEILELFLLVFYYLLCFPGNNLDST